MQMMIKPVDIFIIHTRYPDYLITKISKIIQ